MKRKFPGGRAYKTLVVAPFVAEITYGPLAFLFFHDAFLQVMWSYFVRQFNDRILPTRVRHRAVLKTNGCKRRRAPIVLYLF
jgi:hypothetical protein